MVKTENEIAKELVHIAYTIHSSLGPGLLESIYEQLFVYDLKKHGFSFEQQIAIPIVYDGTTFPNPFRLDLLVEDLVIVELKSVESILPVHKKQVLTYLRITGKRLGLLINFNEALIKDGLHRIVNGLPEGA